MAAFSTIALVAGGILAGAVGTKLATRKKDDDQNQLAPGPSSTNTLTPPAPPIVNPADANAQANGAANRQRKRAARGSLLTNPVSGSTMGTPEPRTRQRSLLGS